MGFSYRYIEDDLRGVPRLPMEDQVIERTGKELVEKLKAQGFDIHDPRDDRDTIITHEIEHIDSQTVGGERVALKAYWGLKRSSTPWSLAKIRFTGLWV